MNLGIKGKRALVTGAATGLGKSIAIALTKGRLRSLSPRAGSKK